MFWLQISAIQKLAQRNSAPTCLQAIQKQRYDIFCKALVLISVILP
jgi:hypothetical protein